MTFCGSRPYLVGTIFVPIAAQPPQVLDGEHDAPVALNLLQMAALERTGLGIPFPVAQQARVLLVAGQDVDGVPEAGPAQETTQAHACGDQAGGGFYSSHTMHPMTADQKTSKTTEIPQ